jgi:hypothetical protein
MEPRICASEKLTTVCPAPGALKFPILLYDDDYKQRKLGIDSSK